MMNARIGLILTGLAFGIWEAVDIFWIDVPAMAAIFAALFLGCTLWFRRRDSVRARPDGRIQPPLRAPGREAARLRRPAR